MCAAVTRFFKCFTGVLLLGAAVAAQATPASKVSESAVLSDARAAFVENKGQWDAQALFHSQGHGLDFWVTGDGAVMDFHRFVREDGTGLKATGHTEGHVVRMRFADSKPTALEGLSRLPGDFNYFVGDRARWATGVGRYTQVLAAQPYDGISVRYSTVRGAPRYDLDVKPGADPSQVAIRIEGANGVRVLTNGNLGIETSIGEMEERGLTAYQEVGGRRVQVPCQLDTDGSVVRFSPGAYDISKPLIIDPLVYSTFVGADGCVVNAVALDSNNNPVIAGQNGADHFPVTVGAYRTTQQSADGEGNAFVAKLKSDGSALMWGTLIGGTVSDDALFVKLDASGNPVVVGSTRSVNFPTTTGAFQTHTKEPIDTNIWPRTTCGPSVFVAKLNSVGTGLLFSTFLSGSGSAPYIEGETPRGLILDSSSEPIVVGSTYSSDFPVSTNAIETTNEAKGPSAGFVTKLNETGTGLVFSTYLGVGGYYGTSVNGVVVDKVGNPLVVGDSDSLTFPSTTGAYQTTGPSFSVQAAFATKLSSTGSALVFSTFLGTGDSASGVALDASGDPVVAGLAGPTFPTTAGSFEKIQPLGEIGIAYVAKLKADGTGLDWATFYGTQQLTVSGLTINSGGDPIVYGSAYAIQATANAYDSALYEVPNSVGYLAELSSNGASLLYGSYFPSPVSSLCLDTKGNAILAGTVAYPVFPTTPGAYEPNDLEWSGVPGEPGQVNATPGGFLSALSLSSSTSSSLTNLTVAPGLVYDQVLETGVLGPVPDSTGVITLSSPATVDTYATVFTEGPAEAPSSVKIPAGASTVFFSIYGTGTSEPAASSVTALYSGASLTADFTVIPNGVKLLTIPQGHYYGGDTFQATLQLQLGDTQVDAVSLSSNSPSISIPKTVWYAIGATTKSFTVAVLPVTTIQTVTVTANLYGTTASQSFVVYPSDPVISVSLSKTSYKGPETTLTGTLTLSAPAPAGGTLINLATNFPSYSSPIALQPWVTVPAGAKTATFPITVSATVELDSTGPVDAIITADSGGSPKSATLGLYTNEEGISFVASGN